MIRPEALLAPDENGLYCPLGGFHIDPVRPVERALITHGHADHARSGHGAVLATAETLAIMSVRYGEDFAGSTQIAELGEVMRVGDVEVTFHPAGHVLGSAQIAVTHRGTRGAAIRPASPSSRSPATSSSPRRHSASPSSAIPTTATRSPSCSPRSPPFPSAPISSAPMRSARRSA